MKKLDQIIADYYEYHTNVINQYIHFVGIPCVTFGILIFFSWIHISVPNLFSLNLAWILVIVSLIYYYLLDVKLAFGLMIIIIPLTLLANWVAYPSITKSGLITFAVFFIGGWILQLAGHLFEGRRPALVDNVWQVFSAPLFVGLEIAWKLGWRQDLISQTNTENESH